jgi:hypothetical protein
MKTMNRQNWLRGAVRGGTLAGIVGLCYVLNNREEKFECAERCGRCPKNEGGVCALGLK